MTGLKKALRSRRGFTLVELVVVLVIAGITASFAVPALTGYIDNAKEKQAVSETQACVMAATRIAAQKYALVQNASITGKSDGANSLTSWAGELKNEAPTVTGDVALTEGSGQYLLYVNTPPAGSIKPVGISSDAGVKGTVQWMTCNASGQVLYLVYTSADGIQVVYTATGTSARVDGSIDNIVVPKPDDTKPEPNPNPEPAPGPEPTLLEVTILKVDASTKLPLGDAELQILNEDGMAAASWTSSTSSSGHSVSLPVGNYVLRETSAPGNYDIAADIKFVIASNGDTLSLSGDSGVSATSITMEDKKVDPTKSDKVFIHLQDAVTGSSSNFANKTYTVTVPYPKITYDVTADANGNIPFEIYDEASGKTIQNGQLPAWVNNFTITEKDPIPGYQPLKKEYFTIEINKFYEEGTGKYLGCTFKNFVFGGNTNGTFADGNVITLQYFPTAVVKILTTDEDNKPLADAFFNITDTSGKVIFKNLRSDSQGYCSVPLQLNSGDGMREAVYLNKEKTYKLIEVTAPTGYQSGVNCSLAFNFSPYPNAYMNTPGQQPAAYNTWFKLNIFHNNYGEWGRVEQYGDNGDNGDIIHVVNSKKLTCTTYLYKIDDAGNPVSDAKLALRSKDGNHILLDFDSGGGGTPNLSSYQSFITNSVPYVVQLRRGKTYELEEITPPQNYTKAEKITFTVPSGADTFTVSMTDHNSSEDKSDIKFDKVTFNQANNWAHKLTTDDEIKFSGGEIICWKGIAYYNYDNVNTKIPNSKRNTYEKNPTELNNAPDPMEFLNEHLKKAADYIVPLTGKAYHYNDKNVTLQKGDIVIPEDYGDGVPEGNKNKKVYVYIGDTDSPLTGQNLSDKNKNFTTLEHKPQDKNNNTYNFTLHT